MSFLIDQCDLRVTRENGLLTRERGWHNRRVHARANERERKGGSAWVKIITRKRVLLKYIYICHADCHRRIHKNARLKVLLCYGTELLKILKKLYHKIINYKY